MKKNQYRILTGSLVLLGTVLPTQTTRAANLYWDGTDLTADADGGAGSWDTTTQNWDNAATAGANAAFTATDTAIFGGTGGNVSLAAAITAAGINVNANGYTIGGNNLTLGAGGSINVATGVSATVGTTFPSGLTKTGAGTLVMSGGANSYTGATVISAGTLQVGNTSPNAFRYYRFNVVQKFNTGDGYNQFSEFAYFKAGAKVTPTTGASSTGITTNVPANEGYWGNANDNLGQNGAHTKFGTGAMPYWLSYDFGTAQNFDGYNWATANDSPGRNPARWQVLASTDNVNWTIIDDQSRVTRTGPTALYTWSAASGVLADFALVVNANPAVGAAKAYPINYNTRTSVPTGTPVQIAGGATFDLNGRSQRISSLADSAGAGGTVTSNLDDVEIKLELGGTDNTNFSGVITDLGETNAITLVRSGSGAQTLSGTASNTYSGQTIMADTGKLILAKTGGAIAVPHDLVIQSNAGGNANATGVVLGQSDQIADNAKITFPANSYDGGPVANSYFRMNGKNETIRGLVTTNTTQAAIENRGLNDATVYGPSVLTLNVPGTESYSYSGQIRNVDGAGSSSATQTIAIVKTGTGTQILSGAAGGATGASQVNNGLLRIQTPGVYGTPMLVTGTGTLDGNGSITAPITVSGGGIFTPGIAGVGTFTNAGGTTVGTAGTLTVAAGVTLAGPATVSTGGVATVAATGSITGGVTASGSLTSAGTLGSTVTVQSGGAVNAIGTVANTLTVQSGGTLTVGPAISTLTTNAGVNLAGTINMQIDKTGGVITNDKLSNFTGITYGGTLALTFTGDVPLLGEPIQLFAPPGGGATFAGSFANVTGLPSLPAGNQWDLSGLLVNGTIKVTDTASLPTFTPIGGDFQGAQSVTLSGDAGATIYYTMDGSEPTLSSPSGPSPVTGLTVPTDSDVTIKAFATLAGFTNSAVVTNVYHTVTLPKWIADANGNWTDTVNWDRGVTANGVGVTADFTTAQTAGRTVTLNASRTVGKLTFANANPFAWLLVNSNSSTLSLATSTGTPEIAVADITGQDYDLTINAPIAGTQGFTKTGLGTLALSGAKTYTGTVTIEDGRLSVDSFAANGTSSPLGAGSTMVINGGILRFSATATNIGLGVFNKNITIGSEGATMDGMTGGFWFISGVMSGPGTLTKIGARQMIIQAANTFDGQFLINEGEVQIRTADALGSTVGNTVVADTTRLAIGGGFGTGTVPENLVIKGMGGNVQGAIQTNDAGVTPTFSGTITLDGDAGVGGAQAGVPIVFSGKVTGTGGLIKVNANALTLSGAVSNDYLGTTTMGGTGKIVLAKTGGAIAIPGNINLSSTAWNGQNSGVVLGGNEQIADTSIVTWTTTSSPTNGVQEDAFLRLNGYTETVGGLVSAGNGGKAVVENRGSGDTTNWGNGTLIVNVSGANSYSYNGGIRNIDGGTGGGIINFVKSGTGTQIMTGGLGYTGTTTVNGGVLQINSVGVNSATTVNTGGTLKGTGSITGTLTVATGATVAPGASAGTLSVGASVIDGTYQCEIDGATADRLTVTGDLDIAGATLDFDIINAPTADSYIIASYTGTLIGSFVVVDLPSGYEVFHNATAKQILLRKPQGYAAYATANGLSGDPSADFDNDGLADGVEYVLGSSQTANSSANAPTAQIVGGNLVFTFNRSDASMTSDTVVTIETSTTLVAGAWTSYLVGADTAGSTAPVTVTDNGANDTITLSIPINPDKVKVARLKVTITPPTP